MAIKLSRPNPTCRKGLTARDEMAGRKVRCPACGGTIDIPADNGGLDQLEEVPVSAPRRRPAPPPEDDYHDYDRPPRRAPAGASSGGSLFASKGLSGAGTIFLSVGVAMLLVLAISTFFPWRAVDLGLRDLRGDHDALAFGGFPKGGGRFDMPSMPSMPGGLTMSGTTSGAGDWRGLITLILALVAIAFVLVDLFA